MTCPLVRHSACTAAVFVAATAAAPRLHGQSPSPPGGADAATFRPPTIALVQPPSGGTVPRDKPVVVFRFAPGEATDPIDARSFAVTVDGADRTGAFQVTATEAWGLIADPSTESPGGAAADAQYTVAARICSLRGACAGLIATIGTASSPAVAPEVDGSRRERFIDLLIRAARKLLGP